MEILNGFLAIIASNDAILFALTLALMYPIISNIFAIKNSIINIFIVLFCTRLDLSSIKSPTEYDALQKIVFEILKTRNSVSFRNGKRVPYPKTYYSFLFKKFSHITLTDETLNNGILEHRIVIIVFFTYSNFLLKKIQDEIDASVMYRNTEPNCYIVRTYDDRGYVQLRSMRVKTMYDIALFNQNNLKIMEETAEYFLTNKIVNSKSVLLAGPTGSGKTTIVKHIAVKYNLPIFYFPLHVPKKRIISVVGEVFDNMLNKQGSKGIVLLEECDRLLIEETLPLFLNILDGVAQMQNKLIILTTNFPEKLDARLVRKGRARVLTFTDKDVILK